MFDRLIADSKTRPHSAQNLASSISSPPDFRLVMGSYRECSLEEPQDSLSSCAGWALIRRGEESGDLSTLCEGFLQPPPSAFAPPFSQTHGLISGPACRSHVAWTSSNVVLHYHRPTLFMSDIPGRFVPRLLHPPHAVCNNSLLLCTTTTGEHLLGHSPDASVSREGFAILEWTVLAHFPLAQATKLDFQNKLATTPTGHR
jgi:hypothetical protein